MKIRVELKNCSVLPLIYDNAELEEDEKYFVITTKDNGDKHPFKKILVERVVKYEEQQGTIQ